MALDLTEKRMVRFFGTPFKRVPTGAISVAQRKLLRLMAS